MASFTFIIFFLGFVGGLITAVTLIPGIRVSLLDGAVVAILLYSAYLRVRQTKGRARFIPKLWLPILLFPFVALLSGGDLLYIIRWLLYAALYWVAADSLFRQEPWRKTLVACGITIALLGFVQYLLYPDLRNLYYLGWDPHYQRLFSTLLDPNFAGIILVLTALLLLEKRQMLLFVLITGALLLTYSRSSFIAFAVGLAVWGMLTKRKILVSSIVVGIAVLILLLPHTGEGRNLLRTVSSVARLENAKQAVERIAQRPLLGFGIQARAGVDTSLLFVGATTGLVGLASYVWILVSLTRLGVAKHDATYLGSLAALLVHSLFVNSLFYPWVMAWLWIMAGTVEQKVTAGT